MKEEMLKVGVVGTGAIGRTHIERINNILSGAKVIGCADAKPEFCKKAADQFGIKVYQTGEDLINDPDIDAIVVTTSDPYHERYVLESIKAGKYVFCEKPMAPSAEACKRIVEAEMNAGKKLVQVGFMRRCDPGYRQLKEAVSAKKYGEPLLLHCAHRNPEVPLEWDNSSAVENSMVHEIDVLRWLLGEDYVTAEVRYGKATRKAREGLFDPQVMILTTKSGVRIDVESFVCNGQCYDIKCEVVCEDAILNLPKPATIEVLADTVRGNAVDATWATRFTEAYNVEFQEWINATKEGRVAGPTAWDGYACQVAAAAASKARDTQTIQPVIYDEMPDFYKA
jgi:myo-inositol 2-dehydrogenase/D-chiro-inositol 1-dehydrogenase